MINIIMLGPPCSGKGTHAKLISDCFNLTHVSTGELFRAEIVKKSPLGILAKQLIDFGNFIPDSITMKILYHHIKKSPSAEGYLFDGFPRTTPQAQLFTKYLKKHNQQIDLVLYLHAPENELLARMENRSIADQRADDNAHVFKTRIENYYANTHILTQYYTKLGLLASICTDNSIAEVSAKIFELVSACIREKK